jgi:hypothetical protein
MEETRGLLWNGHGNHHCSIMQNPIESCGTIPLLLLLLLLLESDRVEVKVNFEPASRGQGQRGKRQADLEG